MSYLSLGCIQRGAPGDAARGQLQRKRRIYHQPNRCLGSRFGQRRKLPGDLPRRQLCTFAERWAVATADRDPIADGDRAVGDRIVFGHTDVWAVGRSAGHKPHGQLKHHQPNAETGGDELLGGQPECVQSGRYCGLLESCSAEPPGLGRVFAGRQIGDFPAPTGGRPRWERKRRVAHAKGFQRTNCLDRGDGFQIGGGTESTQWAKCKRHKLSAKIAQPKHARVYGRRFPGGRRFGNGCGSQHGRRFEL